uniref:DNA mismatch repair protein MutS n=1 Tax=Solibacter usitatus (strain Ellin6076) TaxID=234267 RepID=MUTS_SOLUE|nr:RecName: Full=DNA mismatch repair protein MutS [Candidatus Solibacter usitatus Ellin6076]
MSDASTPLMRQYNSIKEQVPNALLMFRLGDFYELFFEDAVTAARELEITLTARNKEKGNAIPMCGVPYHAAEGYISRLIQKGFRVAICDQVEDAKLAKKLVRREITRVVTPGTAMDSNLVRSRENNFLAAVGRSGSRSAVAHVDVSTGEFRVTEMEPEEVAGALEHLGAREVLFPGDLPLLTGEDRSGLRFVRTELEDWVFTHDYSDRTLRDHFKLLSLDGCGLANRAAAIGAAGAILHYLRDTQRAALDHLDRPTYYDRADSMVLDSVTVRNLELIEPLFAADAGGIHAQPTVLGVLDQTLTGMGGRLLRQRLLRPSMNRAEIEQRLDAVGELQQQTILRAELRKQLSGILDLERLLAKVTLGSAGPRDVLALGRSLEKIPALKRCFDTQQAARLRNLHDRLDELADVASLILDCISDEPPLNLVDGGTIRAGFHPELDELRDLSQNGKQYIAQIEARERQRTGIGSLKVRFNNVFGYYIEITRANQHLAPADYERKQTLANAERFTTPELKDYERKVLDAEDKILTLEKELFSDVRKRAAAHAQRIRAAAAAVAELDVTASLAQVAAENRYQRPCFSDSGEMRIMAGRHPVIERLTEQEAGRFIPNDLYLNDSTDLLAIITGPNMGGKSTYLRQAALIAILAQIGSFVPAESASLPVIDRIFTRIGASDNLARGRSTFMVEMTETAVILNTATPRSFIVLDEVGRGTATYDGLALAWAVVEYIHQRTRAKTLFATHYHELTELAEQLSGVRNLMVSVKEAGDHIIFLRKVEPGKADRSYGIEVARLAGLPISVIERARDVLKLHERTEHAVSGELVKSEDHGPVQIQMFEPVGYGIAERIRAINVDELRPIEALQLLSELQKELKRS